MHEPAVVRVPDGLGELADHSEAGRQVELGAVLDEVVVEPHRIAALVDDQRRTDVVLQQFAGYQQDGMVDALTREELPLSGMPDRLPLLRSDWRS